MILFFLQAIESEFYRANYFFKKQKYHKAESLYIKILNSYKSPEVFYNLGNTYFKEGKIGMAKLYYIKSLIMDPRNPLAKNNLLYVRRLNKKNYYINRSPLDKLFDAVFEIFSYKELKILIIFSVSLFLLLVSTFILFRKKIIIYVGFLSTILLLYSTLSLLHWKSKFSEKIGILTYPSLELSKGPGKDFDKTIHIKDGCEFKILDKQEGYTFIQLGDGTTGWIPFNSYKEISISDN